MSILKKLRVLFVIFFILLVYIFFIEPIWLEFTYHKVSLSESGRRVIKIAHVTDLHTKGLGTVERKLVDQLSFERPDIILITGDIVTPQGTLEGYGEVLEKLQAPMGVYFVHGNWEYSRPSGDFNQLLKELKVTNLTNKKKEIKKGLWLVGFDDESAGRPELSILSDIPKNDKRIGIFHSPSFFSKVNSHIDLAFAGHSHGGQIRIPFLGALWMPYGVNHYDAGWFSEKNSSMYVSRGIGNSLLPIRFNCRPELALISVSY